MSDAGIQLGLSLPGEMTGHALGRPEKRAGFRSTEHVECNHGSRAQFSASPRTNLWRVSGPAERIAMFEDGGIEAPDI